MSTHFVQETFKKEIWPKKNEIIRQSTEQVFFRRTDEQHQVLRASFATCTLSFRPKFWFSSAGSMFK